MKRHFASIRLRRAPALIAAVAFILIPAAARSRPPAILMTRDWSKAPAVVEVQAAGDVFALGEVHGDYDRMAQLLRRAGLIDRVPFNPGEMRWSAGEAVLVCTGDMIDKGTHSLDVLTAMIALQRDAKRAGGVRERRLEGRQ